MYSKQEATAIRQQFWTSFGAYMSPIPNAEGERINWVNYKTGEKNIYFKMHADNKHAYIAVELTHPDAELRELYFHQFQELKRLFEETVPGNWIWNDHYYNEHGKQQSRIYCTLQPVNLFNKADWPAIISFFKEGMIGLDDFWCNIKPLFEQLR